MTGRGGAKKEVDPELLMKQKFRAKCLFRALGRLVMANAYWLIEGVDQYEGFEDVKRRVEQAVRGKGKKKQLLSINDKALLNKPAHERSDQEKQYLYRIIGGLKCFKRYPNVALREGCIVAKMKSYETNETLLGDGVGVANFVYFILSGRCQMIESLQVIVTTRLGRNYYTLHDPYIPIQESEQDFDTKYFGAYKNLNKGSKESQPSEASVAQLQEHQSQTQAKINSSKAQQVTSKELEVGPTNSDRNSFESNKKHQMSVQINTGDMQKEKSSIESSKSQILLPSSQHRHSSIRFSVIDEVVTQPPPPQNLKTYFMQVCQMNPGSSFGFGENMRDRRIVALTPVDCMLLPKIWLLQRNTANIWTRIQHYLEKKIPTKKQLFKDFVASRRWQEFREQLVEDVVSRSNTVNWTSVHDVPYSIRMEEMVDI